MSITLVITVVAVLLAAIALAAWLVPSVVRYQEHITIRASAASIYDAIRNQHDLMRWSAWPPTTGSTCATENTDGIVGARTVFFSKKGKRFGFQEVVALVPNRQVDLVIHGSGSPQKPYLRFILEPIDAGSTRVTFDWTNTIVRPFNVVLHAAGIVRWTREMHRKDLDGLKRYCEPPFVTYTGQPARAAA